MDEYQMEFAAGFGESYQNCPACGKEMVAGHSECFSCGVVVDRFQDRMSTTQIQNRIGGIDHLTSLDLKRLDKKWKQVVVNYHDQEGHQDFLSHCQKNGALPFAIHHYSRMLEIDKEDDIADTMRRQALTRLTFATEVADSPSVPPAFRRVDRFIRIAIGIGIFLSSLAIMAGTLNQEMRNLIGLGVSFSSAFHRLVDFSKTLNITKEGVLMRLAAGLIVLTLLAGCATTPPPSVDFSTANVEASDDGDSIDQSIVLAQRRAMDRLQAMQSDEGDEVETTDPDLESGAKTVEHEYQMDTKSHLPKVQKWIKYYSKKDRKRFQRFLNRGARYKQVIQDLLVTNGLPPDLYYLGILESGYVTKAISRAGAVGPWQFMAPTGRQYGLKINNYVDERVDPVRSTLAAIRYLKELYRQKKSWYMALAAYNAGPGRVRRAVRRGGTRNYWKLTRRRLLPYDTREYIPQFLAILSIGRNLDKYGFREKTDDPMVPMELVKVPAAVPLLKLSEISGISLDKIKKLNPHIRKSVTPPTKSKNYHIWVAKTKAPVVEQRYDFLARHRVKGLKVQRRVASRYRRIHRVRQGQNLSSIARRYGTSVGKIKRINGLRSNRIYVGQKLRVKGSTRSSSRTARVHKVRRGENLSRIARKYGTSVARLKKVNGLRSGRIYVGQKIKLKGSAGSSESKASLHRVRRGENLFSIAKKYATSVSRLKSMNGLSSGRIYVGQKLKLRGSRVAKNKLKRYRIRRGDNLYKIARKFGTTIRRLKKANNLRSNRIMRGQVLLIASN